MKHYFTPAYVSNEVSFAKFYKHCLNKFEKVSEVSLINDSTIFRYTYIIVHSYT